MNRVLVAILLVALFTASTIGCVPVRNDRQLANIEAQLKTLTAALASTQQELAAAKQALADAQDKTRLLQHQAQTAPNNYAVTTGFATTTVTTLAPTIVSFSATPTVIMAGQPSNLQWNITGADSISIDQGIGTPRSAYGQVIYPMATTTYTLVATNSSGSVTSSATVVVNSAAVPVIISFMASPAAIAASQSSTLQWNVFGADSVSINPAIGNVSYGGAQTVYPSTSTTYILTATNSYRSVTAYATITVSQPYTSPYYPNYSGYPYYNPGYTFPPLPPTPPLPKPPVPPFPTTPHFPFPRHSPSTNNSTSPHLPFTNNSTGLHPPFTNNSTGPRPPFPFPRF